LIREHCRHEIPSCCGSLLYYITRLLAYLLFHLHLHSKSTSILVTSKRDERKNSIVHERSLSAYFVFRSQPHEMSSALEKAFGSATLSVVVPETASTEPPKEQALVDKWLERITTQESERGQAFYDELLESLLLVRIEVSGGSPSEPPKELLSLLSRVQISVEAAYISASSGIGGQGHSNPRSPPTLQAPPRTQSLLAPPGSGIPPRPKSSGGSHHPSIFPPATPNPTPFAAEQDKRYINAEGTPLLASFWGQDNATSTREAFWLLWSEKERSWVAVYRLALTVGACLLFVGFPPPYIRASFLASQLS
jgi:hypothetical protein